MTGTVFVGADPDRIPDFRDDTQGVRPDVGEWRYIGRTPLYRGRSGALRDRGYRPYENLQCASSVTKSGNLDLTNSTPTRFQALSG